MALYWLFRCFLYIPIDYSYVETHLLNKKYVHMYFGGWLDPWEDALLNVCFIPMSFCYFTIKFCLLPCLKFFVMCNTSPVLLFSQSLEWSFHNIINHDWCVFEVVQYMIHDIIILNCFNINRYDFITRLVSIEFFYEWQNWMNLQKVDHNLQTMRRIDDIGLFNNRCKLLRRFLGGRHVCKQILCLKFTLTAFFFFKKPR